MTIQEEIVAKLQNMHARVSTAESCTGGLIAAAIVDVSGASDVFEEGFVTYSNEAKHKNLGVRIETLNVYGAVSPQTASEMAAGCAERTGSEYAVVSTGIAGPLGGTAEKPVGLVYLGCYADGHVYVYKNIFSGDRMTVRKKSTRRALEILWMHIAGDRSGL